MYWYLSTPYSLFPSGQQAAWVKACRLCGALMMLGVNCYSSIAETHAVLMFSDICYATHEVWMDDDRPKMLRAAGLICARLVSWERAGAWHKSSTSSASSSNRSPDLMRSKRSKRLASRFVA
jgi:Domain of unknown function (DUF1937)